MRLILVVFAVLVSALSSSAQTASTGNITTYGKCSPTLIQPKGKVEITCDVKGISPAQAEKRAKEDAQILSLIRQNSLNFDVVIDKLNELLKRTNPNLPVKTYSCSGEWRTSGPGLNTDIQITGGGNSADFDEMVKLNNSRLFQDLLTKCQNLIQAKPEWLSSKLFCSVAYMRLGDTAKAKEMLAEYDSQIGPAYSDDWHCENIAKALRSKLK